MKDTLLIILKDGQSLHIETNVSPEAKERITQLMTTPHSPAIRVEVACQSLSVSFGTKFGDLIVLK